MVKAFNTMRRRDARTVENGDSTNDMDSASFSIAKATECTKVFLSFFLLNRGVEFR